MSAWNQTDDEAARARRQVKVGNVHAAGMSGAQIARELGIATSTVYRDFDDMGITRKRRSPRAAA